jgi:tRNA (guanine37-N1)-methyltransferase
MVLKPEPIFDAVEAIEDKKGLSPVSTVLLSPQGRLLTQDSAQRLAGNQQLILICGHYEGVDERVREYLADDEISIGDYVLSGGEAAAMVVVDCVVRLLPDVLGSQESLDNESHINGLLEYPQYTRPSVFRGWSVPAVLLSGNHAEIANWRKKQSLIRTSKRRPDLIRKAKLTREDKALLNEALTQNANN